MLRNTLRFLPFEVLNFLPFENYAPFFNHAIIQKKRKYSSNINININHNENGDENKKHIT